MPALSEPTTTTTLKRNLDLIESPNHPAKRPRSEDLTSLQAHAHAHAHEGCSANGNGAGIASENEKMMTSSTAPGKDLLSGEGEGKSRVCDGQKVVVAAAIAGATPTLSESTRRIMAYYAQNSPWTPEVHKRMLHFLDTTSLAERRLYYIETGQDIPAHLNEESESDDEPFDSESLNEQILEEIDRWEQAALANDNDDDDDELDSDSGFFPT